MKKMHCAGIAFVLIFVSTVGAFTPFEPYDKPYAVSQADVVVPRPDGSSFGAILFIPDLPTFWFDPVPPPSGAAVVFGHGFLTPPILYQHTLETMARTGFLVMAPRSALEPFPDHDAYAEDLRFCLDYLVSEGTREGSLVYGRVDPGRLGLAGHSMGGGASILAASRDERVRAVAVIAGAETRPSAIAAAAAMTAPVMYITGSQDTITPSSRHTLPMLRNTFAPSIWIDLRGGSHCGFVPFPLPPQVCDEASIPLETQILATHNTLIPFFQLHLAGEASFWKWVWGVNYRLHPGLSMVTQPDVALEPRILRSRVPRGGVAEFTFTLTNHSDISADFHLDLLPNPMGAEVFHAEVKALGPGESVAISVRWHDRGWLRTPVIVQARNKETQVGTFAIAVGGR